MAPFALAVASQSRVCGPHLKWHNGLESLVLIGSVQLCCVGCDRTRSSRDWRSGDESILDRDGWSREWGRGNHERL